ncbi:MAG TPA: thioredoxin reductase [Ruminococcaceae bacterium]|jgi:thioredoxin reductase (NADPH)|nr:thioredoxin reductase [Oscillospiraceae bacterium]HCE25995.1 thioredoxin reductase [Oscillospiraceae bacterium]
MMYETNSYDIAIIGTGPAGISAAINAAIRKKKFILFGSENLSAKVECSHLISNYPALPEISGKELNERLAAHLKQMDIVITAERITGVYNMGKYFMLLADQKEYKADAVILATGAQTVKEIKGERELLGRGVSYCATCDGNFYKDKTIAVISDNKESEEEVDFLAGLARKVYFYPSYKTDYSKENVEHLTNPAVSVDGERHADGITLKDGAHIAVDGVFFLKQSVSADVLLGGLEMSNGSIAVDRDMSTNIKGCFACGDCTGKPYQIAKAIGEGNTALHSAIIYLSALKSKIE